MSLPSHPVAFGHWTLDADQLLCRMPRKTVAVTAPGGLLRAVLRLCDGRMAWKDVAAALARSWASACVDGFLAQLAQEGLLVQAGESLAHWAELGQAAADPPRVADEADPPGPALLPGTGLLPRALPPAASALLASLGRGYGEGTFGDEAVALATVGAVLCAAGGVPASDTPSDCLAQRSVARPDAPDSARWFLVALRALPDAAGETPPGLYEARFHVEGGVSLKTLQADTRCAWRVLQDPRALHHASALLLCVHEVAGPARRHGDRATLLAHLAAGRSLQNAQLMAGALGAAAATREDTLGRAVLALLAPWLHEAPGHWLAMPALVLGAPPSDAQAAQRRRGEWLRVRPAATLSAKDGDRAAFAFSAGPVLVGETQVHAMGRSDDPRLALRKAEAEAWERQGWARLGNVLQGRQCDIEGAIAPGAVVAYTPAQYATPGFPLRPFEPDATYLWAPATQVRTGRSVYLPAECVYARVALPPALRERACAHTSTSGMAAWTDPEGALCAATLELVERDAFAHSWLAGTCAPLLLPHTLPGEAQQRVAALEALGHRVALARITAEPVPVIAVFLQHRQRPFTAITTAAGFDAEEALAKALDEAEARAAHAAAWPAPPLTAASQVRSAEDVNRYYQTPGFYRRADFHAAGEPSERFHAGGACRDWPGLQAWLAGRGLDLLALDLTPEGAAVDQGRSPLRVMRAVVPGLIPIWFGHGLQPAGLPAFAAALARRAVAVRSAACFIHPFT